MKRDKFYLAMACECGGTMFYRGFAYNFHFFTKDDGKSYSSHDSTYLFECDRCGKQVKSDEHFGGHVRMLRKCECNGTMVYDREKKIFKCLKCDRTWEFSKYHQGNIPIQTESAKRKPDWISDAPMLKKEEEVHVN